ncbi:UNVERIFIED_CONTAM: hypothetical protein HDU68_008552 [Siphonaria sp. JEL0065]|nr:hypothetical protein HDU68_008552 [Siphonaria sp. JEL0065]
MTADSLFEPTQFDPSGQSPSNNMANMIDSDARNAVSDILLKIGIPATPKANFNDLSKIELLAKQLERICIRSQPYFISLVIGHLPFTLVNSLIRILFLDPNDPTPSPVETLIQSKGMVARKLAPKLGHAIFHHTDALHQSLLRTSKNLIREYSSAAATRPEEQLPCFPVFDETTGSVIPVFKTRCLTIEELRHPNNHSATWTPNNIPTHELDNTSLVPSLEHFKRGLRVFAPSLTDVKLNQQKVILAGGAVSACLAPWSQTLLDLFEKEKRLILDFYQRALPQFPQEIIAIVDTYSGFSAKAEIPLNDALFPHFHGRNSCFKNSDVDLFFMTKNRAEGPAQVADDFWATFESVRSGRSAADIRSIFDLRNHTSVLKSTAYQDPDPRLVERFEKEWGVPDLKSTPFRKRFVIEKEFAPLAESPFEGRYCGVRFPVPLTRSGVGRKNSFVIRSDPASIQLVGTVSAKIRPTACEVKLTPLDHPSSNSYSDYEIDEWDSLVTDNRLKKRESRMTQSFRYTRDNRRKETLLIDKTKRWRRDRDWIAHENKLDKKANWGLSNQVPYMGYRELWSDLTQPPHYYQRCSSRRRQPQRTPYYFDTREWSRYREQEVKKLLTDLPIVRTVNSITVVGMYPVRHVQLMVNVIRSPEELMLSCDLDCTAVFYDGQNVFATHRSLRAFNTRRNFIEAPHFQDNTRLNRIVKYAHRGFGTTMFEMCKHFPRCDVQLSAKYTAILADVPRRLKAERWLDLFDSDARRPIPYEYSYYDFDTENDDTEDDDGVSLASGSDLSAVASTFFSNEQKQFDANRVYYGRFDYLPASIPYGPLLRVSRMKRLLESLEMTSSRGPFKILDDSTTLASDIFKAELLVEGDESGNMAPLQLKHYKDRVTRNRIQYALSFESCYMCGTSTNLSQNNSDVKKIPLCQECTDLNTRKRETPVDLTGYFAVVTGARIKIGQEITLRLLRSGCTVYATTRFPLLMINHFLHFEDSHEWWDRLFVHALDLRDVNSVLSFCTYLEQNIPRLDILIQNAAQTIRRTADYYRPMVMAEIDLFETMANGDMLKWTQFEFSSLVAAQICNGDSDSDGGDAVGSENPRTSVSIRTSPHGIAESAMNTLTVFPDTFLESAESTALQLEQNKSWNLASGSDPTDARSTTTWTTKLPSVAPSEIAEVMITNSISPALLMQRLLPLLSTAKIPRENPSFIVNVSSREGIFNPSASDASGGEANNSGGGSGVHPHTNMAKAALNRLTQTCAREYLEQGVYVTAVDPGWVSWMTPPKPYKRQPPLMESDGAARVLDPIVVAQTEGVFYSGVLLKNFKVAEW